MISVAILAALSLPALSVESGLGPVSDVRGST